MKNIILKDSANNNVYPIADSIYVGVVLDATGDSERFLAMKQLYDIAEKVSKNPSYVPSASEFTYATKGIVCRLPKHNAAMYENYPIDILYAKNADVLTAPASTTKVVALVTGMDYVKSVKDKVTLASGDIESGSGNFFNTGDVLTIEDLMLGMMLPSSNTCAKSFAHYVGSIILGDNSASVSDCVTAFVNAMNAKAIRLGCANHVFDTPSGLSKTNRTTAADMLKFVVDACSYPEILRVWNKKHIALSVGGTNPRTVNLDTTVANATLEADYYIFGGKTGSLEYSDLTAKALVMVAEPK